MLASAASPVRVAVRKFVQSINQVVSPKFTLADSKSLPKNAAHILILLNWIMFFFLPVFRYLHQKTNVFRYTYCMLIGLDPICIYKLLHKVVILYNVHGI